MIEQGISAEFPFESHTVEVLGSKMHYVDEGAGEPILFLHGNPTWSYLWRNVLPHLSPVARVIAPDLIGMGRSDKPDIDYRFRDHARYVDGFIEALGLEHLTLVLHDWGSALGFDYARRNEANVRAIAFAEAILAPTRWRDFPRAYKTLFRLFRAPGTGSTLIQGLNVFIKKVLPSAIIRDLSPEEMRHYLEPYPTFASRKPLRRWPCEIPIDGRPQDVHETVAAYNAWLQRSEVPKLLMWAKPGALIRHRAVDALQRRFANMEVSYIGRGIHYVQEDSPDGMGQALRDWFRRLP